MTSIVIVGGGIAALTTATLLADDGHGVTVLERDPDGPTDAGASWERWETAGREPVPPPAPVRVAAAG